MRFRPCIDIHNGKVKQIVGGSLADKNNFANENYVSEYDGEYYGKLYKSMGLKGGHIILLNPCTSEYYQKDLVQAKLALKAFEGGFEIGGGVNCDNAVDFIEMGATHIIVTSYVFSQGKLNWNNLKDIVKKVGKQKLVLDLSCRKREDGYYIVTDRWQKFTSLKLSADVLQNLAEYCDEFLVHAVDFEGKKSGIDSELIRLLGEDCPITVTYAGGISTYEDIEDIRRIGRGRVDFTVGSALDIFGGKLSFEKICTDYR